MEELRVSMEALNARLQAQENVAQQLQGERQQLQQELQQARQAPRVEPAPHPTGVVDTRVMGKPGEFAGDVTMFAEWSFKMRSYLGAVDHRYQGKLMDAEQSQVTIRSATMEPDIARLSTQLYYILVMITSGSALDKCHNAGVNEGFEAWRQFVLELEPRLRGRFVVDLRMQAMAYKFTGDIPSALAAFERPVPDYESQSNKKIDDEKIGVALLGMEGPRAKGPLIRSSAGFDARPKMREEILEIIRTQQCVDSQPTPMQLGAIPRGGKDPKGGGPIGGRDPKGGGEKGKDKGGKADGGKNSNGEKECFYCRKKGHVKSECRKRQRDLAAAENRRGPLAATPGGQSAPSSGGPPPPLVQPPPGQPLSALLQSQRASTFALEEPWPLPQAAAAAGSGSASAAAGRDADGPVPVLAATRTDAKYLMIDTRAGVAARRNEAEVKLIVSVGEAACQGNWFVFGPGHQVMLPSEVSKVEFDARQITHLPFRSRSPHCAMGKASDGAHHPRPDATKGAARLAMNYFFLARAIGPRRLKSVLDCLDMLSGAVFAATVVKGGDPCALAVAIVALMHAFRTRATILCDQENAVATLAENVRDSGAHETALLNTFKGSSANDGGIEQANCEVEKQFRTLRHAAWLLNLFQVKSDGGAACERLRGRPCRGQVSEFGESVCYRGPQSAPDMPKLDDRWMLGARVGESLASDERYIGTPAGVRRRRSIWRRPESARWDRKILDAMVGEPWNPKGASDAPKAAAARGVYITLDRQIQRGGTPGCPDLLAAAELVDSEWAQQIIDWGRAYDGVKSGTVLDKQKVCEGRVCELANMVRLGVVEPISIADARSLGLKIVDPKWLEDEQPNPEGEQAMRCRLVATQVDTYNREDATQATPPIKAPRMISTAATKTNAKGRRDRLIGRHDIRVAFFHATGSGKVVIIPPRGLAPPGVGWRALKVDRVLTRHFDAKVLPRIGPPAHSGEVAEGQHLGRAIRWTADVFEWQANPKHRDDLLTLAGLDKDSKGAPTQSSKSTAAGRCCTACSYSAWLKYPTEVWLFRCQKEPGGLCVYTEADWAADELTRHARPDAPGKVRHLAIEELWVQEALGNKEFGLAVADAPDPAPPLIERLTPRSALG
ncbi:unnamed protein product [Prorocentrum cordatum]|uniref:CCHC-type domain-containing protein n=1 Tax=Prorocentrum cordatum TaxID=2364126 RepID=A0ABN9PQ80_9DINO|nr:unnamed protein product [Polarella glacialis]